MYIKKTSLVVLFFITSLLLVGCGKQRETSVPLNQDIFEEKHAEEMQKKAEEEIEFAGEGSPTLDLLVPENGQDIVSETVEYIDGINGFLAYPQDNPQAPGVVVIHEWWGLNDHIKDMARVLAMNGYRALAVDLYEGNVATEMEEARGLMSNLDKEKTTANLLAAEQYLRQESSKVASLGWCLGGAQSLNLSLASDSLDATVIYYGRLVDDAEQLANINQPLLGIFAEEDGGIPPSAVESFQTGLDTAGKTDYDITIYPNVGHAFANPTGNNYEQEATIDAWSKTLEFLNSELTSDENIATKVFDVTGDNFSFSLDTIEVNQGDVVTINFESVEGFHDWVVDEFDAATEKVRQGTPTSVTFTADKTGEFEYYCSVGSHRANGMVGTLIVK